MPIYTIATVMPTGKKDPTYGQEFYVKFAEHENTFKLWYKTAPKEGTEVDGTIDDWKFTKTKKEYVTSKTDSGAKPKKTYGAVEKDKQDGMRQGMCINNAAYYIAHIEDKPSISTASKWADAVHEYAQALYEKGSLTPPEVKDVFVED